MTTTTTTTTTTTSTITKQKKASRRPRTTGRFDSRAEFVDFICDKYYNSTLCQAEIARLACVSETTVANMLKSAERDEWLMKRTSDPQ